MKSRLSQEVDVQERRMENIEKKLKIMLKSRPDFNDFTVLNSKRIVYEAFHANFLPKPRFKNVKKY